MKFLFKNVCILIVASFLCGCSSVKEVSQGTVVTSFYPIYLFTLAVTQNTPIDPVNLANTQTGCLHDYQLTTGNMRTLNNADIFVINGAGMENGFINKALEQNPNIQIIDSSENAVFTQTKEHNHTPDESAKKHGIIEINSHIWLSAENAKIQTENIAEGLSLAFPQYADTFKENAENYCSSLSELTNIDKQEAKSINVVSFHESYSYLCDTFGINIVETIEIDENTTPSALSLAHLTDKMISENVSAILCADDGGKIFAETMARELNLPLYILNPIISGNADKNSYIEAQQNNYKLLKGVLTNEKP